MQVSWVEKQRLKNAQSMTIFAYRRFPGGTLFVWPRSAAKCVVFLIFPLFDTVFRIYFERWG